MIEVRATSVSEPVTVVEANPGSVVVESIPVLIEDLTRELVKRYGGVTVVTE